MTDLAEPDGTTEAPGPESGLTPTEIFRRYAIASVKREFARPGDPVPVGADSTDSTDGTPARPVATGRDPARDRPRRRSTGPSVVYTVRLGHDEVAALERRADALGVAPTVLARRYIRDGLRPRVRTAGTVALDELEAAVVRLRDVVG